MSDIRATLDLLYASRSAQHLANDPLSFCHRFPDPLDREIAALVASSFAYGSVAVILRSLETIFRELGPSPRRYVEQFEPEAGLLRFSQFKHRFNDGRDLCALLRGIQQMLQLSGSIEAFFLRGYSVENEEISLALDHFSTAVKQLDYKAVFGSDTIPSDSYFPFLFPAPSSGSACKRLCMFLRWVVRPDDGIDLGLWHSIPSDRLIIPLDTHISRIARYLGLTSRKSADWRMAGDITRALKHFDPDDPVKYDFSLAHLGISDGCNGSDTSSCIACLIGGICTQNQNKQSK